MIASDSFIDPKPNVIVTMAYGLYDILLVVLVSHNTKNYIVTSYGKDFIHMLVYKTLIILNGRPVFPLTNILT